MSFVRNKSTVAHHSGNTTGLLASLASRLPSLPRGATTERMKWAALVFMTLDHVNRFALGFAFPWMFAVGRLAMPLFALALGINLARPGAGAFPVLRRTTTRLLVLGVLTIPAFAGLSPDVAWWWPLNILFSLALIPVGVWLSRFLHPLILALILVVAAAPVDYFSAPALIGVGAYWIYSDPARRSTAGWLYLGLGLAMSCVLNGNLYALLALPLAALLARPATPFPRLKWTFYIYYPAHLYLLLSLPSS